MFGHRGRFVSGWAEAGRMSRKLEVGATLNEVFSLYRSQAGALLPVAFWLFLAVAIVNGLIAGSVVRLPIYLAIITIARTLYQGMVVGLVRDVQDGRGDSSATDLIRSVVPVLAPLIAAGILSGIGIFLGFFLLIVPGLILSTIWAVISPVIVVERSGVVAAFGRSRELVRGNGGPVFGVILVSLLIAVVVVLALAAVVAGVSNGPIVRVVFNAIAATLIAPVGGLAAAVLYFRLQAIEGASGAAIGGADAPVPSAPPAT